MAFDLLYLDGHDLRDLPLIERKRALQDVLAKAPAKISYADFVELQDSGREGWLDPPRQSRNFGPAVPCWCRSIGYSLASIKRSGSVRLGPARM
jgi:hypothetical protein